MGKFQNNPSLFREMSEPFESAEAALESLNDFADELADLREKHRIQNVYAIMNVPYKMSDGTETESLVQLSLGDSRKAETLTAWAYGYESVKREERLAHVVADAKKQAREK